MIIVSVPGKPQPKGRPRVVGTRAFTPTSTRDAEERIAWALRRVVKVPLAGKLAVKLSFHTSDLRADVDNLAKLVLDAGNKVAWIDDRHIWDLHIKRYQVAKGEEMTTIEIEGIE